MSTTLQDGTPVIVLDRSEFADEAEYQEALERYLPRPKMPTKPNGEVDGFPMITRDDIPA